MADRNINERLDTTLEQDCSNEYIDKSEQPNNDNENTRSKRKRRKWPFVLALVAVIVFAAGVSGFVWHEEPSFCGAICHTPMNEYLATYNSEPGANGTDKWGDNVDNTRGMLSVTHKAHGKTCLDCHVPTIEEQLSEGVKWVSGDYIFPLEERTLTDLTKARDLEADQFCLNDSCHHLGDNGKIIKTREDLQATTNDLMRNPHVTQHQKFDCGTCHKAHRPSTMYCSSCHADSEIPVGWENVKALP